MLLANTYHLWVRPGADVVERLGGLHRFVGWDGPILTDSGGFQAWSLGDRRIVTEDGVRFRSPEDGLWRNLTPEIAVAVQEQLGVDIAMALDECIEAGADEARVDASTARTTRWLDRCLAARRAADRTDLWGIVQGGTLADRRREHARALVSRNLDGYAIGGLSVGEDRQTLRQMVGATCEELPASQVRYLMGVGTPPDVVDAIALGVDLFDCVAPTRAGRHGQAWTWEGRRNLRNARYRLDPEPLDVSCGGPCCRFSRAYLRHLVLADEILVRRLLSEHNLRFLFDVVARARAALELGDSDAFEDVRLRAHRAWRPAPESTGQATSS
jgi:queuine tRNA-ribosyltransferase